ncbi:MAG: dethiobiotin synthase [Lentisphaeria bacterium]|nr:dethiobiotin synthase [Lentisphaeria bacterium]
MTRTALFITATGTDVGKTFVSAALLRALLARNIDCAYLKPIQTGGDSSLTTADRAPDLRAVLDACGPLPGTPDPMTMAPAVFRKAASPHLAAALEGRRVDFEKILAAFDTLSRAHDVLVVEGAGGIMVPLGEGRTTLDLMQRLAIPALVVTPNRLGCVNETLLTLDKLARSGIETLGVLFNRIDETGDPEILADNPRIVAELGGVPVFGELPQGREPNGETPPCIQAILDHWLGR